MSILSITTPQGDRLRHQITRPVTRIGRSSRNDLILRGDPTVSKLHACIEQRQDGDYLLDESGRSSTFLNGEPLQGATRLQPGDRIRLGGMHLRYQDETDTPVVIREMKGSQEVTATVPLPDLDSSVPSSTPPGLSLLDVLVAADEELLLHHPPGEVFDRILDLAESVVPFERGAVMTLEGDALVTQRVREVRGEAGEIHLSSAIAERVLRDRQAVLIRDVQHEEAFRDRASLIEEGVRSAMCVPLSSGDRLLGLLYVDHRGEAARFHRDSLVVLTHFANVAATAIELKRLVDRAVVAGTLKKELRQAALIQERMLPSAAPCVPGYEVHGYTRPCTEVGGDLYNYHRLPDGRLALGIGDVAGKGLPAALLMGLAQSALEVLVEAEPDAVRACARLNRLLLHRAPENRFVALFLALVDPARHSLTYVNAGLNLPLMVGADGVVAELPTTGFPLGMFEDDENQARTVPFRPGDCLLVYSDGVTDAVDRAGHSFGLQRLRKVALRCRLASAVELVDETLDEIREHQGEVPNADDLTLVAVRRLPGEAPPGS